MHLQEYRPDLWRVWKDSTWVDYDLAAEAAEVKVERLWSEAALQAQRRNNARCKLLDLPFNNVSVVYAIHLHALHLQWLP